MGAWGCQGSRALPRGSPGAGGQDLEHSLIQALALSSAHFCLFCLFLLGLAAPPTPVPILPEGPRCLLLGDDLPGGGWRHKLARSKTTQNIPGIITCSSPRDTAWVPEGAGRAHDATFRGASSHSHSQQVPDKRAMGFFHPVDHTRQDFRPYHRVPGLPPGANLPCNLGQGPSSWASVLEAEDQWPTLP